MRVVLAILPLLSLARAFELDWYLGQGCTDTFLGRTIVTQGHGKCHKGHPPNVQSVLVRRRGSSARKAVGFYKGNSCDGDKLIRLGNLGCIDIPNGHISYNVAPLQQGNVAANTSAEAVKEQTSRNGSEKMSTTESSASDISERAIIKRDAHGFEIAPTFDNDDQRMQWEKEKFQRDGAVHGALVNIGGASFRLHQVAHNAWRGISPEEWDDDLHKRNTLPLQVAPEPRDLRAINTTDAGPGIEALPAACQAVLDCGLAIVGGTFDLVKTAGSWAVHAASACAAAYSHNCMAHEQALFINRHPYITWISYITFGFGGGYFAGQLGADFPVDEASSKQLADCSGVSVLKSTEEYIKHCARGNAGINAQSIECAIDFKTCLACPRHEGKIKAQATPDMKGHKTHPGQCGVQGNTKRGMLLIGA